MFKLRDDERRISIVLILLFSVINFLYIHQFYGVFWPKLSGYDPWVHGIVTDWIHASYVYSDIFTHSLFSFLLLPLYGLNMLCIKILGFNCADYILGIVLVFNSFFSFIFLKRIFTDIIELSYKDALLLSTLFFSFAYIMLMIVVPEHFPFSMFLLIMLLYVSGIKIKNNRPFSSFEMIVLYILTAGITITNGIKAFFSYLFVNGIKSLSIKKIVLLFVVPTIFICMLSFFQMQLSKGKNLGMTTLAVAYEKNVKSKPVHVDISKVQLTSKELVDFERVRKERKEKESAHFISVYKRRYIVDSSYDSFFKVLFCNFLGESFQFHRNGFLENRIFGLYKNPINHVVQITLLLAALFGFYLGRNDKFLRLCLSFFLVDFTIHIALGYAFKEIYIMAPHWTFLIPICIGYLFKYGNRLNVIRSIVSVITIFLVSYNGFLFVRYCLLDSHLF